MVGAKTEKISIVVICGPTGTGKTSLALSLAEKIPIEIISADSRQVYRRMDIGTAKATLQEQAVVPHHMIDLIDPDQEFSVAEFIDQSRPLLADISARNKIPCVVGGTGLYIRALLSGLADLPSASVELRKQLLEREEAEGRGTLHSILKEVDPESATQIHANNVVRIVRALEVFYLSGKKMSELKGDHGFAENPYRVLKLAPEFNRSQLYARINHRAEEMLSIGLVDEVKDLVASYSFELKALQTLGYREVVRFLKAEINQEQMLEDIQKYTRQYAKRQLTWFRKEEDIIWVDSSTKSDIVVQSIDNFYLSKGVDMPKSPFNIQDQYLNQARKERVKVALVMMTGEKLEGYIKSFDSFCILAESDGDVLVYKHAVSSITSIDGTFRLHGGRD